MTMIRFDLSDAEFITRRFQLPELRAEFHTAEINTHPDCDDFGYWLAFTECVKRAIELKKQTTPPPPIENNHIDVDDLKSRVDIVNIISRYCDLRKAGRSFKARCPFHNERTPSFTVNPDRQTWHCFGTCNTGGDVIGFIMKAETTDFLGAVRILGGD